jgi:hypothetical protein
MMIPAIRVMNEYRTLVVKMYEDKDAVKLANTSFEHLIDVQIVISLACLMPLLKCLHSLMQFSQKQDVFICDLLAAIKLHQTDITVYYINQKTRFQHDVFWDFKALSTLRHDAIPMRMMHPI